MKILVTGGAGFIGSAVVRHIINNTQDSVVNVDKLTYAGNLESLADVSDSKRYVFEHADICDAAAMARIFAQHQPDAVMHLAAESHVDRSITGPAAFIETNIVGTYVLLEAARNYWSALDSDKKNSFRFHHISTDEVYGDLPHPDEVNNTEELPLFTETTAYAPSSPYSASKASSDHLVRAWKRTYGLPTNIKNLIFSSSATVYGTPEKIPVKETFPVGALLIPMGLQNLWLRTYYMMFLWHILFLEQQFCVILILLAHILPEKLEKTLTVFQII